MKEVWLKERPIITAVIFAFAAWVVLELMTYVLWVLVAILVASILAAAMMPIVRLVRRASLPPFGWRIPKWLAVVFIYLSVAAVFAFLSYLAEQVIFPELRALIASLPQIAQDLTQRADSLFQAAGISGLLPSRQEILAQIGPILSRVVPSLGLVESAIGQVFFFFYAIFFVLILALFLVEESEPLTDFWVGLFPPDQREKARTTITHVGNKVGYWILGQLTVATITALVAGLGVWMLGLPYPFLIGTTTGLLDLAPIIGPSFMAIPVGALALTISPVKAVAAVLLFYGLSFLDGHVLSPSITGRFVQLRMTLVLIAVVLGLALYGAVGVLVAIPVTAGAVVVIDEVFLPWFKKQQAVGAKEARERGDEQGEGPSDPLCRH